MHWYQWFFSGVGVILVAGALRLLSRRFQKGSGSNTDPKLVSVDQGSAHEAMASTGDVMTSSTRTAPVAVGRNVNQSIVEHHHHYQGSKAGHDEPLVDPSEGTKDQGEGRLGTRSVSGVDISAARATKHGSEFEHNVQFLGIKSTLAGFDGQAFKEVFDLAAGHPALKACFLNKSVPGMKIKDLDYVKVRVVIKDVSGEDVASIAKPLWLNHDPEDRIHLEVNTPECILIAMSGQSDWAIPFVSRRPTEYWESGRDAPYIDGQSLPCGELSAEITLVDGENVGLEPVTCRFSLSQDGTIITTQR
jgi:hypothetical protein